MYYEINISLNGVHFFATHNRSLTSTGKAIEVLKALQDRFSENDGYAISLTINYLSGTQLDIPEFLAAQGKGE